MVLTLIKIKYNYMGQYYHPISIDKKEWLYSHDYDNGLKLMEHSWVGNVFVENVEAMLIPGGRWYADKIIWAGDYADLSPIDGYNYNSFCFDSQEEKDNALSQMINNFRTSSCIKIAPERKALPAEYIYVVNRTKKLFVNKLKGVKNEDGWMIHPLPLLTSDGNGQGGGDFRGKDPNNLIGTWALDSITIEKDVPEGYHELIFDLYE